MTKKLDPTHFDDQRIEAVIMLGDGLTTEEREFLIDYTAPFEECFETPEAMRDMTDKNLMQHCYNVWADYASGQV